MPILPGRSGEAKGAAAPPEPEAPWLIALASGAAEREAQVLVEGLRLQGVAATWHDLGHGVICLPAAQRVQAEAAVAESGLAARLIRVETPYRLARRDALPQGSRVALGGVEFGGQRFVVVGGPCAVESRQQIQTCARLCGEVGIPVLRGGAFKPRTSPYAFQGMGLRGLEILAEAGRDYGLPVVSEVVDPAHIERMYPLVDAYQVGARNMHNFELLKALGDVDRPVVLKRGPAATLDEWLLAAEYVLIGGNSQVILCERGIRTFNANTRYTLDLATAVQAKGLTHLPVILDPTHATGRPELVAPLALAGLAAGLDGLIFEFHPQPELAKSDGPQALRPEALPGLMAQLAAVAAATGRRLGAEA
jgi:3-deoxy-7-phosphoheptulonate synthase